MTGSRAMLVCWLAGILVLAASARLMAGEEETPEQRMRREAVQKQWAQLPAVEVGTSLKDVRFTRVVLDKSKVQVGKDVYYALRFRAPESGGDFLWAWRPELLDQRVSWGILAAQGTTDARSSQKYRTNLDKDVKDLGTKGNPFFLHWLDIGQLTSGGDYILWFQFEKAGLFTKPAVVCSLNVIPGGADMRWKDIFPMLYQ
jgi:hypothetical protein